MALSRTRARIEALDKEIAEFQRRLAEVDKLAAQRTAAQVRLAEIKIDKRALEGLQSLGGRDP